MKKIVMVLLVLIAIATADTSITHVVFCWMDSTVSSEEVDTLIAETRALSGIPGILSLTVGRPVQSERPIVDDSFSFGITMTFENSEKMQAYLGHEKHTSFVAQKLKPKLAKIVVYDIEDDK